VSLESPDRFINLSLNNLEMFHGGLLKRPGPTLPGSVSKMGSPPPTAPGATAAAVASAAGRKLEASWRPGSGKYIFKIQNFNFWAYTV